MPQLRKHLKSISILAFGVVILLIGSVSLIFNQKSSILGESIEIVDTQDNPSNIINTKIYVEVGGAVNTPGVYEFLSEARVNDAINRANGVSSNANTDFILKNINKAGKLTDGQKIYIPFKDEESVSTVASGLININTASQSELESLEGVGPATAKKIIDNRPYGGVNDLSSKKAVTNSVFEKIKDKVSVY